MEEIIDLISEARKNMDIVHIKNIFSPIFDWSDIIFSINDYFNSDYSGPEHDSDRFLTKLNGEKTNVFAYKNLNLCLFNFLENNEKINKKFYDFTNSMNILKEKTGSRALIDLVGNASQYNIHKDLNDGISFQQLGKMEWRVFGDIEGPCEHPLDLNNDLSYLPYKSYIFEPGDGFVV